ncbi:hypothetical protein BDZ91DRAFT_744665 [Kalaharituber pfeilii]|nr:hypothetical protein BDZ91DRAFT_744665 [Kalaharituber pfeilii]
MCRPCTIITTPNLSPWAFLRQQTTRACITAISIITTPNRSPWTFLRQQTTRVCTTTTSTSPTPSSASKSPRPSCPNLSNSSSAVC